MNEVQLITFGAGVTFIGVAAVYAYMRERWLASHVNDDRPNERQARPTEADQTA